MIITQAIHRRSLTRRVSVNRRIPFIRPFAAHSSALMMSILALGAGLVAAAPASAQVNSRPVAGGELSYNAALVSDYRLRGVSQTFRGPAIQGGIDWAHPSGLYLGTWASRISKAQYPDSWGAEWDIYAGYKFPIGAGWTGDVGLLQYRYPGESFYNTLEAYVAGSWKWLTLKYSHGISNKYFGYTNGRNSQYFDATVNYPLMDKVNLIAHWGATRGSGDVPDYMDYRLGATYDYEGWILGASAYKASKSFTMTKDTGKTKDLGGTGFVFSVGRTF